MIMVLKVNLKEMIQTLFMYYRDGPPPDFFFYLRGKKNLSPAS